MYTRGGGTGQSACQNASAKHITHSLARTLGADGAGRKARGDAERDRETDYRSVGGVRKGQLSGCTLLYLRTGYGGVAARCKADLGELDHDDCSVQLLGGCGELVDIVEPPYI
jgi:hypothetical protein